MGFNLIILDCDGVLIDSRVIRARQLIAELAGYDVVIDMAFVSRQFLGRNSTTVLREVRETFGVTLSNPSFGEMQKKVEKDVRRT